MRLLKFPVSHPDHLEISTAIEKAGPYTTAAMTEPTILYPLLSSAKHNGKDIEEIMMVVGFVLGGVELNKESIQVERGSVPQSIKSKRH